MSTPTFYQIRVKGHLGADWSSWFGNLSIENQPSGEAVLSGAIRDQSELHGILNRIRDLNLTLIAVESAVSSD